MLKQKEALLEPHKPLLQPETSAIIASSSTFETSAGTLTLRKFCPPSLVKALQAESGLHAFARIPRREHELLLKIAQLPDSALTLAYTATGEIVGQVTIVPCETWWQGLQNTYEIAIEVSSSWRRLGLAKELLTYALACDALEDMILLAVGLSWHWDTARVGMPATCYRGLIAGIFEPHGFSEYQTAEPNINEDPANILLVRIGNRVEQQAIGQFINRLLGFPDTPTFP